jgi:hypothetical protein
MELKSIYEVLSRDENARRFRNRVYFLDLGRFKVSNGQKRRFWRFSVIFGT